MTYDSLVRDLIIKLPEFQEAYKKEVEWWDGQEPSPHNFFGDVVTPYLMNLLNKEKHEEVTTRIFGFLMDMASSEDVKIQEVLAQSVLERLGDDKVLLAKAYPFMSDNVQKLSRETEKFWGRQ